MTALLLSLPNFDRRYVFHKEMGSGVGFKNLRPIQYQGQPRKTEPIAELHYAAAVLKSAGHNVIVDDDQYRDSVNSEDYKRELKARCAEPSCVFVRTSLPTFIIDLESAELLRSMYPGVPLYIFGPIFAAAEFVDFAIEDGSYDGIITSEIEAVILDLVDGKDSELIPGFHYLKDGAFHTSKCGRALADVENLPLPAYECVDTAKIDRFMIHTSRGCPIGCNYCPYYLAQGHKFRAKTAERAFEEFKHLAYKFGARKVAVHDPIFTLDKKRVVRLCELLIESELDIEWECETHMAHLDPPMIELMHKAGLRMVAFGVESANEKVLDSANRRFKDWSKVKENVDAARAIGIGTRAYFIMALPGDTVEGAFASIELAKYLGADSTKFNLPNPYPGTAMFKRALDEGWMDRDLYESDRREFYRVLGLHGHDEPSMTPQISDRQAQYLSYVGNHEIILHKGNGSGSLVRRSKILAYQAAVHGIGGMRRLGLNLG